MSKWIYVIWDAVSSLLQFLQFFFRLKCAFVGYNSVFESDVHISCAVCLHHLWKTWNFCHLFIALVSDLISLCLPGCWKLMTQRSQRVRWTRTFTALWSSIVPQTALSLSSFKFYYSVWREYWAHCWCQITFLIYRRWLFNTLLSRSEEKYIWNVLCSVCSWCRIFKKHWFRFSKLIFLNINK